MENKKLNDFNGYWVDDNNNRWCKSTYSHSQALSHSKSLNNCRNCINCINCSHCIDCADCKDCRNCINCINCIECADCKDCIDCTECIYCRNCIDCRDFNTNPQRITSKKIGSRESQSTYYWTEEHDQMVCGCFTGTLDEFEKAVEETHGDNNHGKSYKNWIKAIKAYKILDK